MDSGEEGSTTNRKDVAGWRDFATMSHFLIKKGYSNYAAAQALGCSNSTLGVWVRKLDLREEGQYNCPWDGCGKPFLQEQSLTRHHLHDHGESIAGVEVECKQCGTTYREKECRVERTKFCSKSCRNTWMGSDAAPHGEDHPVAGEYESIPCEHCGDIFDAPVYEERMFCSRKCYEDDRETSPVTLTCETCGEKYRERACREERSRYCSKGCIRTGKGYGERISLTCTICGTEYSAYPYEDDRVCCSASCRGELVGQMLSGEENSRYSKIEVACDNCGTELLRQPHRLVEDRSQFCSQECHHEYRIEMGTVRGQNNPMWKGGFSTYHGIKRLLPRRWGRASKKARVRDGNTCQMCGTHHTEDMVALDVHHIVPILSGGTNAGWNLISLCSECHKTAEEHTRDLFDMPFTDWSDDELPDGRERWTPNDTPTPAIFEQATISEFGPTEAQSDD